MITDKEYLEKLSKEQLIIRLRNTELQEEIAEQKLFLLTSCPAFGSFDPMNGSCWDCDADNKRQCDKCIEFTHRFSKHWREYCKEVEERNKENKMKPVNVEF